MKQLFVDIQFMQTGAYSRGMGQHIRGLFKSALNNYPKSIKKIYFIYSSNLDNANIREIEHEFKGIDPKAPLEFIGLDTLPHDLQVTGDYDRVYTLNKAVCELFYNENKTNDDVWFNPCPMQEPVVPVVLLADSLRSTVLWYDLMPYVMHDHYFPDPATPFAHSYLSRMNLLLEYDHILTISENSKNDLVRYLALDNVDITNTQGWVNTEIAGDGVLPDSVKKPFILLNASPEPNKNATRAIEAFHIFNQSHENKYQLVVTSDYNPDLKSLVESLGANVNFIGHVPSPDLKEIYDQSEALLFVSLYEGLGLPPLEAVNFNKKIILSDTPVHQEFGGGEAFYWCDPYDVTSIASAITSCVKDAKKLSVRQSEMYKQIKAKYSWDISANLMWSAIKRMKKRQTPKEHIAVVGPHPSSFSSIGKFVAETYPAMTKLGQVNYYFDQGPSDRRHGKVRFNYLQASPHLKPIGDLIHTDIHYDRVIYHMGNSDHHMVTYLLAHARPDMVVLHDTSLGGDGLAGQMLSNGYMSKERHDLEKRIETEYLGQPERFISSLVSCQSEIVVHSNYAKDVVKEYYIGDNSSIVRLEHPLRPVSYASQKSFFDRPLRLGIAGIMTEVKGINTIDWIMSETNNLEGAELHMFGFGFFADKQTLRDLESRYPNIKVSFDLSDLDFNRAMEGLDLLINYREIYKGEASRATLEAIRERVVPIVRNIGWFAELPDATAYKLDSIEDVPALIRRLAKGGAGVDKELQERIAAGQRLLVDKFLPEDYVRGLV